MTDSAQQIFPKPDVRAVGTYLPGYCPDCGRYRLEVYADSDRERAVGIRCEKCGAEWLLDPTRAVYHSDHSVDDPLNPRLERVR